MLVKLTTNQINDSFVRVVHRSVSTIFQFIIFDEVKKDSRLTIPNRVSFRV